MDGGVAARGPAGPHLKKSSVVRIADVNVAGGNIRSLGLRVATQAKVWAIGDEQFVVDGTVWVMTSRAAFAQGLMLKNKRPRLRLVTTRAALILPRHGQAAGRLEDVATVRIMAIHAIHEAFHDRMMLGQIEFGLHVEVALETGRGIFSGIDDEAGRAAGPDMFAAGAVAGFTTSLTGHGGPLNLQARVRAGREFTDDVRMAIRARLVADVVRAWNLKRGNNRGRTGGTRNQTKHQAG